jgi:hypothetical protein
LSHEFGVLPSFTIVEETARANRSARAATAYERHLTAARTLGARPATASLVAALNADSHVS